MQPNDYTSAFQGVQNPAQAFTQAFAGGAQMRGIGLQQEAQAVQIQQQQQAQERARALQAELLALSQNPTPQGIAAMSVRFPELSEQAKRSFDMLNTQQKEAKLAAALPVYSAAMTGRTDLAVAKLEEQATALEQAGNAQEAKGVRAMAQMMRDDPASAVIHAGTFLSGAMGADKFADTFGKLGSEARANALQPSVLAKSEADAKKATIDAKYAEQGAILDLQKKGWDIKALQEDIAIKREANRIAAMNAATSREGNSLKREELRLKVEEARQKLDSTIREKAATAEAGATNIDNMLNTIERIKKNPSLNDVLGSIEGRLPAIVSDEAADAIALIDTLGSQAFLAQIPNIKGMGALSNAEGEKLQSALQNLSRKQSEKQFVANLEEAARLLNKGRDNLAKSTGVPLGKPDTPAAPQARPPLSSFMK